MANGNTYQDVQHYLLRYPLQGPTGGSGVTSVDVLCVEVSDGDGQSGFGFSYALGLGGPVMVTAADELIGHFVSDKGIRPAPEIWRDVKAGLNRVGKGAHYLAGAAIDMALWDLESKRAGVPLGVAMGGTMREMPVYGSGGYRPGIETEKAVEVTRAYMDRGCNAVKLRMTATPDDERLVSEVRAALGDGVGLMVDANEKADVETAIWLSNMCAEHDVLWLEEPMPAGNIDGYRQLKANGKTPIASGEHLQGADHFDLYLDDELLAFAQPDLAIMGGLSECLETAKRCETLGVKISPHFLPSLFIHVAAASDSVAWLEDFPLLEPMFDNPIDIEAGGVMRARDVPGHGLNLADGAKAEFSTT